MEDLITFSSGMLPSTARVLGFRGVEALSRPYRFEIFLSIPSDGEDDVNFAEVVGAKARLTLDRADDKNPPFIFAGVLGSVDLIHEFDGRALLRVVLVPRLWELTLSRHSRIFTKKSVPEVIQAVLEDNGLSGADYALQLRGSYETEEHICQYRESDFDFISRWMEREGIFYYFEHTEDGEKLILSDDKGYPAEAIGLPVRYHPQLGEDRSAKASFRSFACQHGAMPSQIKLKDYDYVRPSFALAGQAPVSPNGAGEISLYGERFFTAEAGKRLAKLRAEEFLAREAVYQATGTRLHLRTGYTFELEEHPRARFNAKYLAVEVRHHGNQASGNAYFQELVGLERKEVYLVEVSAIPATTQFRAESRTAWPRIYGFENGTVDGPALSEYAQIDDHGRYLVKFKFDEGNGRDGGASTYVRMMQPHGGSVEGFHFPLRKGTEVVMSFLGGDPDRPVISGVVPNVLTPSAVTSGNFTKNVIQTGGRNRLELEDMAGAQRVTLSTPYSNTYLRMGSPNDGHELIAKTDDNGLIQTGVNLDVKVGGNKTEDVKGTLTETYHQTKNETVTGALTETYESTKNETVTGKVTETYKTGHDLIVTSGQLIDVKGGQTIKVEGNQTLDIKTDKKEDISGKYDLTVQSDYNMTINGSTKVELKGPQKKIVHGPFERLYQSENVNVVKGVKSDTFMGASNTNNLAAANTNTVGITLTNMVGANITNTLGATVTTMYGVQVTHTMAFQFERVTAAKLSYTFGTKIEHKMGASLSFVNGPEVNVKLVELDSLQARIERMSTKMASTAVNFKLSSLHVVT